MDEKAFVGAIEIAIESEIEAFAFYKGVAEKVSDTDLKEMFNGFAEEEKKHKSILEDVLEKGSFDRVPKETRDYKVSESIDTFRLSLDMKPEDAIALAMKKEEMAMKHYITIADASNVQGLKELFENLASMEREHKFKLEKFFVEREYPEVW